MKYCYCKIGYNTFKPNYIYRYVKYDIEKHYRVMKYDNMGAEFIDADMFKYLFKPIVSFESEIRNDKIENIMQ